MSLHDGILQSKAISTIYKPNIKVNNQFLDMNLMTQGKSAEIMIKKKPRRKYKWLFAKLRFRKKPPLPKLKTRLV